MTEPAQPRILADTGGLVVTDDGRRVNVIDRGTGGPAIAAFVLAVIALVLGGFGAVALTVGSPSRTTGVVFLAAGMAAAGVTFVVVRTIRQRRARPLATCRSVAVLDRKLNLFTVAGGALLPLDRIRFERRMQLGSSSRKLVAVTPQGVHVLKRGNPFDGSIGDAALILNRVAQGGNLPA